MTNYHRMTELKQTFLTFIARLEQNSVGRSLAPGTPLLINPHLQKPHTTSKEKEDKQAMAQRLLLLLPAPSGTISKPLPPPSSALPGRHVPSVSFTRRVVAGVAAARRDLLRCGMRRSGEPSSSFLPR